MHDKTQAGAPSAGNNIIIFGRGIQQEELNGNFMIREHILLSYSPPLFFYHGGFYPNIFFATYSMPKLSPSTCRGGVWCILCAQRMALYIAIVAAAKPFEPLVNDYIVY
ncbi:MAG: hypothetical protein WDN26_21180 [Chitinophagaceae bacterium]